MPGGTLTGFEASAARLFAAFDGIGVHRSIDGGATWDPVYNTAGADFGNLARAHGTRGWLVATGMGLFRANEQGEGWTRVGESALGQFVHSIKTDGEDWYASTEDDVFRSSDGGTTWTPSRLDRYHPASRLLHAAAGRLVLDGGGFADSRRSADKGAAWTRLPIPQAVKPVVDMVFTPAAFYALLDDGALMRSADQGRTWALDALAPAQAIAAVGAKIYALDKIGNLTLRSGDGAWVKEGETERYDVKKRQLVASGRHLITWRNHGPVRFDTETKQWSYPAGDLKTELYRLCASGRTLFASNYDDVFFRSVDDGATWTRVAGDFPRIGGVAGSGDLHLAVFRGGEAMLSADNGATWTLRGLPGFPDRTAAEDVLLAGDRFSP